VPLSAVPRYAQLMFVRLEDNTFYEHPGVELRALREAWRANRVLGYVYRGGSTIPMQLARTLWLTQNRTYLRKYAEAWAALEMDLLLPKRRILELYLNSIEFGPGVYGIAAAARWHFGKSAAKLDRDEFRRLAVIVASPLRYDTHNFLRRRALAERYAYLVAAFPDPGATPVGVSPPPGPVPEEDSSGPGVQAGIVVPEAQGGEAPLQELQPGEDP
jgi:monofunctional biosynthetic peptidoglycan transglycosylase